MARRPQLRGPPTETPSRSGPLGPGRTDADADIHGALRWLPGLRTLRHYDLAWLRHDLVAGLVLTAMLVPVGIAYAVASGVPGIHGLYATILPLLAYALFGPSRILVLGPDSALASLILAVVLPLSAGDAGRAVALASAMALVSGPRAAIRRRRCGRSCTPWAPARPTWRRWRWAARRWWRSCCSSTLLACRPSWSRWPQPRWRSAPWGWKPPV